MSYQIRIVCLGLRATSMVGKLVMMLAMSKYLEPSIIGDYGVLLVSVMYAIFFVGLDFYAFSTREIINGDSTLRSEYLKSHFSITGLSLVVFILLSTIPLLLGLLSAKFYLCLVGLVFIEYFAQEFYRLMIALSLTLEASFLLFMRAGLWPFAVTLLLIYIPELRSIETVLFAWFVGTTSSLLYAFYIAKRRLWLDWKAPVNWPWVWGGMIVSLPFLLSSLSMRGVMTFDRYFFAHLNQPDLLGVYVLFISIAGLMLVVVDSTIFIFSYPKLVAAAKIETKSEFFHIMKNVLLSILAVSIALFLLMVFLIDFVISFTGREIYTTHTSLFYLMLVSFFFMNLSNVYHYGLYALGNDKQLIVGNIFCFLFFCLTSLIIWQLSPLFAVSISMLTACVFLFLWKYLFYKNAVKDIRLNDLI